MITCHDGEGYTLTEWKKRVLWPVAKESLWHEFVRLLPITRYESSSEPVPMVRCHTAYGCSAGQEREYRFPSLMIQGMSSCHPQRCLLSEWHLPQRPSE